MNIAPPRYRRYFLSEGPTHISGRSVLCRRRRRSWETPPPLSHTGGPQSLYRVCLHDDQALKKANAAMGANPLRGDAPAYGGTLWKGN
jgi:hypothetical protein